MSLLEAWMKLRLDRWQDEDDPTRTWWERLQAREEYVSQESGPNLFASDYDKNPYYEAGWQLAWYHWGLGFNVESDSWYSYSRGGGGRGLEHHLTAVLMVGPFSLWWNRQHAPNRPNVHER